MASLEHPPVRRFIGATAPAARSLIACVGSALGMPSLVSTCFAGDGMGNEWRDCGHPVVRSELGSQACEGRASEDALDPPLDPPLDRGIMVTAVGAGSAAKKPHVQCVRRSDSPAAGK